MVRDRVVDIFRRALAQGASAGRWPAAVPAFTVESPRDPKHGDFAVNAAMVLAKAAARPPRELAQAIVEEVRAGDSAGEIASLEIAGPGFINLRLATDVWLNALGDVERQGGSFGRTGVGRGRKVIVEYVS